MLAFLIAAGAVFLAVAVSAAIDLIRPSLDYDGTTPLPVGAARAHRASVGWRRSRKGEGASPSGMMSLNEGSCGVRKRGLRVMQTVVVKPLHDCRGINTL